MVSRASAKRTRALRVVTFTPSATAEGLRWQLNWLGSIAENLCIPALDLSGGFSRKAQASLHLQSAGMQLTKGDLHAAQIAISFAYGYLVALQDSNEAAPRAATAGRTRLGNSTREKVRDAALPLRGHMHKGDAADLIAPVVSKDRDTVYRYLTQLFPGDSWTAESDASIDTP